MDLSLRINPYRPGAGMVPRYLAGREQLLEEAKDILAYIANGYSPRSVVYYGLCGVGKTVLLTEIENIAQENNIFYEHIEAMENGSFMSSISLYISKLLRKMSVFETAKQYIEIAKSVTSAFQLFYSKEGDTSIGVNPNMVKSNGIADTGDKQNDLMELFTHLGKVGQKIGCGAVICIDEVQYLKDDEFEALMAAIHRCNQLGLPLVIFAAGLPKIAKIAGDIKSYAERLFKFVPVDRLEAEDAKLALSNPAHKLGVSYTDDAMAEILQQTECYPYFLQEYGQQVWKFVDRSSKTITLDNVKTAYPNFINALDASFFKVRHDRASEKELEFMKAMVKCANLPCATSQVAKNMQSSYNRIAPIRAQLIHKGFIYATNRGEISFTVPQFEQYLKRVYGI
ncbi:MAG: ATP-binding protein [Phascolarctobacterium sp.]|nr:ATP-binding protein [Phascolarctobacterium sp.]